MPRWSADSRISIDDARRVIAAQFPELAPVSLREVGEGWDNVVFRVNERWVFRFPRREIAVGLVESERVALPAIASRVPLSVPAPCFVGRPSSTFPRPFLGYEWLDGVPIAATNLGTRDRARAASALGAFLRALHDISLEGPPGTGSLPGDAIRRMDLAYRRGPCLRRLGELVADGHLETLEPWASLAEDVPTGWSPGEATLVHGDLDSRHVLVGEDRSVVGVIDWGDVHRGDPACDLAIAFSLLPARLRDPFFADGYGAVSDQTRKAARYRALYVSMNILQYAHAVGDVGLAREARIWLDNVAG